MAPSRHGGAMSSVARRALVLGASGDQGLPQVIELATRGFRVRAAARHPERLRQAIETALAAEPAADRAALTARIEPVAADHADAASLARACDGIDVVLANYPSSSFHDSAALEAGAATLGTAAARAGVRLIVFNTSLPLPARPLGFRAQDIRFRQRDALRAAGVPVISMQPVVYMDNLLRGWVYPGIVDEQVFAYPHAPTLEVCWLCQRDLARLMAAAAERPALAGRDFNVGGPEVLRGADVAHALSQATGRAIRFESQSIEDFCARMRRVFERSATLDAAVLVAELGRVYRWYNEAPERPFRVDMAPVLRELPVRLTTLAEWAREQRWAR
jgi:uncharacterized protein YbjT (DUF2867 family)